MIGCYKTIIHNYCNIKKFQKFFGVVQKEDNFYESLTIEWNYSITRLFVEMAKKSKSCK